MLIVNIIISMIESLISRFSSKYINKKAIKLSATILAYGLIGGLYLFNLPFIKKNEIQNTKAIFDIFEPKALPIANIVLFWRADSIDIKISGADVAMPIIKKLAYKPDIEYLLAVFSVDVIKKFDPTNNKSKPINKIDMDSIIIFIVEKY